MSWNWIKATTWLWKARRATGRTYPCHGTHEIIRGKLTGSTDTDYFHFNCPRCGPEAQELDVELIGVKDQDAGRGNHHGFAQPRMAIILGLYCQTCKLKDLVKIAPCETAQYQSRRLRCSQQYASESRTNEAQPAV